MDLLVALGISIGILIGAWVYVAVGMPELGLIVWAGIIAWATFYAAGGGMVDAADIMIPVSMVVGAVLGYISEVAGKKMAA